MIKKLLFATAFISIAIIGIAGYLHFSKPKPALAAGVSWYVDNAAIGANNGVSWANAWQSFSAIKWSSIKGGDTIYISGGASTKTYTETLSVGASGTSDNNRISIKTGAASPFPAGHIGKVILNPTAGVGIQISGFDYIAIDGNDGTGNRNMQITATGGFGGTRNGAVSMSYSSHGNQLLYLHIASAGAANNEHGVTLDNDGIFPNEIGYSLIENVWQDGIQSLGCTAPTGYNCAVVHHNIVRNIGDDYMQGDGGWDVYNNTFGPHASTGGIGHPDGIQAAAGYVRIYNNTWWSNYTTGGNCLIFIDHAAYTPPRSTDHIRIYNNIFTYDRNANYSFTICVWGNGNQDDVMIVNNTIVDAPHSAISIGGNTNAGNFTNIIVKNNLIYNTGTSNPSLSQAIQLGNYSASSSVTIDNNLISSGASGNDYIRDFVYPSTYINRTRAQWDTLYGANNKAGIPSFVHYVENNNINNDYHLTLPNNAVIDMGVDLSSISGMATVYWPYDKDGVSRPQHLSWDIGAYEYIQTSPPLKGDFNSDQKVNDLDFTSFKNAFKSIFNSIFDLNSDSTIDVRDLGVLMNSWLP